MKSSRGRAALEAFSRLRLVDTPCGKALKVSLIRPALPSPLPLASTSSHPVSARTIATCVTARPPYRIASGANTPLGGPWPRSARGRPLIPIEASGRGPCDPGRFFSRPADGEARRAEEGGRLRPARITDRPYGTSSPAARRADRGSPSGSGRSVRAGRRSSGRCGRRRHSRPASRPESPERCAC